MASFGSKPHVPFRTLAVYQQSVVPQSSAIRRDLAERLRVRGWGALPAVQYAGRWGTAADAARIRAGHEAMKEAANFNAALTDAGNQRASRPI
jgi:hypothetical protein